MFRLKWTRTHKYIENENDRIEKEKKAEQERRAKRPVEFNLKTGMKIDEIYNELHGHVSGETTSEIQEFFDDNIDNDDKRRVEEIGKMFDDNFKYSSHEVVSDNGKYALIHKAVLRVRNNTINKIGSKSYISGVNDEGMYFIHPIIGYDGGIELESITDWINRVDEGFTERLQGDILLKFVSYGESKSHCVGTRFNGFSGKKEDVNINVDPSHRTSIPTDVMTIELGRHILLVKNRAIMVQINEGTFVVIESDRIDIVHPEHKKTTRMIPEGKYAVIANQRGRENVLRFD